jgi:pachytene checkpoint protein 2
MSGRALRRLPVLALARYIGIGFTVSSPHSAPSLPSLPTSGLGSRKGSINGDVNKGDSTKDEGKGKALKVEGGGADVEIWLDGMEKVIIDSGEEVKKFV